MAQPEIAYVIFPDPTIFTNSPVQAANATGRTDETGVAILAEAGTIVRTASFGDTGLYLIGLLSDNVAVDGEERGLTLGMHMRCRKILTAVLTYGEPLTFVANPTATENDLWADTAAMGNNIQAYCMADAGNGDEFVEIFGPLLPWQWTVKA